MLLRIKRSSIEIKLKENKNKMQLRRKRGPLKEKITNVMIYKKQGYTHYL